MEPLTLSPLISFKKITPARAFAPPARPQTWKFLLNFLNDESFRFLYKLQPSDSCFDSQNTPVFRFNITPNTASQSPNAITVYSSCHRSDSSMPYRALLDGRTERSRQRSGTRYAGLHWLPIEWIRRWRFGNFGVSWWRFTNKWSCWITRCHFITIGFFSTLLVSPFRWKVEFY